LPQLLPVRPITSALSVANPERCTDATLPFSEWEATQLSARLPLTRLRQAIGPKEATFAATGGWDDADLVHFTCHGVGDENFAPLSHLRLADDLLLAHDVIYRRKPLREGALVVLNGCQTGVRDARAVEEGMGLMTAFLLRGASLVLATRWSVSDLYAAELVTAFLERVVKHHRPPTLALREAQEAARALTADEILQRCEEVRKVFPAEDSPEEARQIDRTACLISWQAGRSKDAQYFAERAAATMRRLGQDEQAKKLAALIKEPLPAAHYGNRSPFAHPFYWSAFELIGRVT